jgi:hypothetical protein
VDHDIAPQPWNNSVFSGEGTSGEEFGDAAFDDELNERQALQASQAKPAVNKESPEPFLDEDNDTDFDGLDDMDLLLKF